MTTEDQEKIKIAFDLLYKNDEYLLQNNCSERAIAFRLAMYLQTLFNDYDVDCEYNLNIDNAHKRKVINCIEEEYKKFKDIPKRKSLKNIDGDEYLEISILPDIIIHKRGDNDSNRIIIEIKKSCNMSEIDYDRYKLIHYTEEYSEFKYPIGLFITIFVGSDYKREVEIEVYEDGKAIRNLTIAST